MSTNDLTPKKQGDPLGCPDTAKPEIHTPSQLSRIHDLLLAAQEAQKSLGLPDLKVEVFRKLPETARLEYIYSIWQYQEKK